MAAEQNSPVGVHRDVVSEARTRTVQAVAAAIFAVPMILICVLTPIAAWRDAVRWDRSVPVEVTRFERRHDGGHAYVSFTYRGPDGRDHDGADSWPSKDVPPRDRPPVVRADPGRAERYLVEEGLFDDGRMPAWAFLLFAGFLAVVGAVAVRVARTTRNARRVRRDAERIAAAPVPVAIPVRSFRALLLGGIRVEAEIGGTERTLRFPRRVGSPRFLDEARTRMLGVADREDPTRILPVADSGWPFVVDPATRDAWAAVAAGEAGDAGPPSADLGAAAEAPPAPPAPSGGSLPIDVSSDLDRRRTWAFLLGVLLALLAWGRADDWVSHQRVLREEREIWDGGVAVQVVSSAWTSDLSFSLFRSTEVTFRYVDPSGKERDGKHAWDGIALRLRGSPPPTVRVDPANPERFALAEAIEERWPRTLTGLPFLAGSAALAAWLLGSVVSYLAQRRRACRILGDPVAVALPVADARRGLLGRRWIVRCAVAGGTRRFVFDLATGGPAWLDEGRMRVLALCRRGDPACVQPVADTGAPFRMSRAQRVALGAAADPGAAPPDLRVSSFPRPVLPCTFRPIRPDLAKFLIDTGGAVAVIVVILVGEQWLPGLATWRPLVWILPVVLVIQWTNILRTRLVLDAVGVHCTGWFGRTQSVPWADLDTVRLRTGGLQLDPVAVVISALRQAWRRRAETAAGSGAAESVLDARMREAGCLGGERSPGLVVEFRWRGQGHAVLTAAAFDAASVRAIAVESAARGADVVVS